MKKLHFSIQIQAPKQKVWEVMLADKTYRLWTDIFNPGGGSYFEGQWTTGSKMRFIGPDGKGNFSGMISQIKESRPYEFLSIEHLGELIEGKEKLWTAAELGPDGAHENYTFKDKDGGTELLIELDSTGELAEMFEDMWPKALKTLKELVEKS